MRDRIKAFLKKHVQGCYIVHRSVKMPSSPEHILSLLLISDGEPMNYDQANSLYYRAKLSGSSRIASMATWFQEWGIRPVFLPGTLYVFDRQVEAQEALEMLQRGQEKA